MDSWNKERLLGTGSFGIVTLWINSRTNQRLGNGVERKYSMPKDFIVVTALKQCRFDLQNCLSEVQKKRWRKEIEIMVKLNHTNIVQAMILPRYLSDMLNSSIPILCMEFCAGGDLRQTLNQPQNCCGLTEIEIRNLISNITNALDYLHQQNITHRDIKPENILLQNRSGAVVYKLTDLGYAKELEQSVQSSSFVGTLQYVAPELFFGGTYDKSVDYWSFGSVCHEIITGVRPFIPQSSPAVWMNFVKVKGRDHICIYQSTNGYIRYSSRLFQENQISLCFQHLLEQWLQNALEWNYKNRGTIDSNGNNLFSQVNIILNKKILKLFCSETNSYLSYEVDDSTAISTLRGWIERDTKVKSDEQILLTYMGTRVDDGEFAIKYYVNEEDVMVYIYDSKPMSQPNPKIIKLPGLVRNMIDNPRGVLNYFYLKRTVAQSIHYIQNQHHLHVSFWNACTVRRSYIDKISQNISTLSANILMEMNKILSNKKMYEKLLKFDLKCCCYLFDKVSQRDFGTSMISEWRTRQQNLSDKINNLLTVFHSSKTKYDKIIQDYAQLENFSALKENSSILKYCEFLKSIYQCYENLPKDKEKLSTPVEAVKIVRDFLDFQNTRSHENFGVHSQKLRRFELEFIQLEKCLLKMKKSIFVVKSEILDVQFRQHKDVWKLLATSIAQHIPAQNKSAVTIPQSTFGLSMLTLNEDSGFVDQLNTNFLESLNETKTILSDNENLRQKLLNNLDEIIREYRVMQDESESIDWTFLKTDE